MDVKKARTLCEIIVEGGCPLTDCRNNADGCAQKWLDENPCHEHPVGCEYCQPLGKYLMAENSIESFINDEDGKNTLDIVAPNWRIGIEIHYCPQCGRKLSQQAKEQS